MVSLDDVAGLALELPEATEGSRHGNRTWSVNSRAFAWVRPFTKADLKRFGAETPPDGPILSVRVENLVEKEAVLAAEPKAFFTIPHFEGYAAVLIQLRAVSRKSLGESLLDGWLACAPARLTRAYLDQQVDAPGSAPKSSGSTRRR